MVARWKIDNYLTPADGDNLNQVEFGMRQVPDPLREIEALQYRPTRWVQAIAAHFFPGKFFPVKNNRSQTGARAKRRAARSGGAAANDCNIEDFHGNA